MQLCDVHEKQFQPRNYHTFILNLGKRQCIIPLGGKLECSESSCHLRPEFSSYFLSNHFSYFEIHNNHKTYPVLCM